MIGSHDSMTFLRARWRVLEWFAFMWRTQTMSLPDQALAGVRYFDIRVRRYHDRWMLCHGIVDLDLSFPTLGEIVRYVRRPGLDGKQRIRLILERGDSTVFEYSAGILAGRFPEISFIAVKRGWKVLFDRDPEIVDLTFTPWLSGLPFVRNVGRLWHMIRDRKPLTIVSHARCNPEIGREMIEAEKVYFMDMI